MLRTRPAPVSARPTASTRVSGCSIPTSMSAWNAPPASLTARWRRSSAKTTCPSRGPVHGRERQLPRPARLAPRCVHDRAATLRHRLCRQLHHQPVAAPPAGQAADGIGRPRGRRTQPQIARPSVLPAGGATGPADGQVTGTRPSSSLAMSCRQARNSMMCSTIRPFPAAASAGRHLWNPAKNRGASGPTTRMAHPDHAGRAACHRPPDDRRHVQEPARPMPAASPSPGLTCRNGKRRSER